ncbi:MAG TPA: transglutaminase family protein [Roseiflexaceae bacterium]|nr:transglutaminase family protein [Roseiflexaceae bacterium]
MRVRVGCEFVIESSAPTPTASIVRPRDRDWHTLLEERRTVSPDVSVQSYIDGFGNHAWRWNAPQGSMRIRYDALADVPEAPDPVLADLPGTLVDQLPDEVLIYTLPSRHCPSDLVIAEAWRLFEGVPDGWARVQAICDWTHQNIEYGYGNSTSTTSGYEAYQQRRGVCRDFAHIAVMFCRAMNIPARYVCGYLPDIGVPYNPIPMDFHAWFEAYIGGAWRTFDARHNTPRIGRVLIARGRDAVDTAILTSYGPSALTGFSVWADQVDEATTLDDPLQQLNDPLQQREVQG